LLVLRYAGKKNDRNRWNIASWLIYSIEPRVLLDDNVVTRGEDQAGSFAGIGRNEEEWIWNSLSLTSGGICRRYHCPNEL